MEQINLVISSKATRHDACEVGGIGRHIGFKPRRLGHESSSLSPRTTKSLAVRLVGSSPIPGTIAFKE